MVGLNTHYAEENIYNIDMAAKHHENVTHSMCEASHGEGHTRPYSLV